MCMILTHVRRDFALLAAETIHVGYDGPFDLPGKLVRTPNGWIAGMGLASLSHRTKMRVRETGRADQLAEVLIDERQRLDAEEPRRGRAPRTATVYALCETEQGFTAHGARIRPDGSCPPATETDTREWPSNQKAITWAENPYGAKEDITRDLFDQWHPRLAAQDSIEGLLRDVTRLFLEVRARGGAIGKEMEIGFTIRGAAPLYLRRSLEWLAHEATDAEIRRACTAETPEPVTWEQIVEASGYQPAEVAG